MSEPLHILLVEDSEDDALLVLRTVKQTGREIVSRRVQTREEMVAALAEERSDIVLSDYYMPTFDGMAALQCLRETGRDIPFILVSGKIGEELAVQVMKAGAQDFVAKEHLARLVPAIERELRDAEMRHGRARAEESLVEQLARLNRAMRQTVQALSAAVEKRDPYTAGHQQRVAALCRALGLELGLTDHETTGIELAALVHDVGKIQIPAEILNKPGRLSEIEFGLIKNHPETGYEIIKGVEFPWPVAEMVYSHHERIDGSGYPRGLRRDEVPFGAHVLAVADVVEAMSSHRPYRPAIGIEAALAEIESGRGRIYDERVVDACLRLFRERGYAFDGIPS
jgi:HD-GYP domain-containing protein (c-di-GMP phosphodiesterase class II)